MNVNISVKILTAASVLFFLVLMYQPVKAEYVFLKDGSVIDGAIVSDAAASVTIRTKDKKVRNILRNNIIRILYTDLKMSKIYVQKRDGEGFVAYIVDEDRVSYTFRKDLYKPEEFVLSRGDVLFIAEKNPSGLKASDEAGTDRVSLTWLPPYDDVNKYNIYITKDKSGKYELAETVSGKSVTLKNLSSNTVYYIIVTSIDSDGYESSPSNELKITTKNIHPDSPVIISSGDVKSDERIITWNPSADIDGKVEKYRIYGTKEDNRVMIAEVKKTDYTLKNSQSYDRIEIASVDNNGDESESVKVRLAEKSTVIAISPGVIIPVGKLGDMYNIGYGGTFALSERNFFIANFEAGAALGFYYMQGKDLLDEKDLIYDNLMMVPLCLTAGYNAEIWGNFVLKPVLSFGVTYIDAKYKDASDASDPDKHLQIFEPVLKSGLIAEYKFSGYYSFFAGCDYAIVRQNNGMLKFASVNAGIGYYF